MRKHLKMIVGGSALTAGLLIAPMVLYAHEEASGMMGVSGNMMGVGSMMGEGSGMMNIMRQMSRMIDTSNNMMQSRNQPPNSHKSSE